MISDEMISFTLKSDFSGFWWRVAWKFLIPNNREFQMLNPSSTSKFCSIPEISLLEFHFGHAYIQRKGVKFNFSVSCSRPLLDVLFIISSPHVRIFPGLLRPSCFQVSQ